MMSSYPQEEESVEQVQVLPNDIVDDNQRYKSNHYSPHYSTVKHDSTSPSSDNVKNIKIVETDKRNGGLVETDASTLVTEVSTDVDETSLRENIISFGSLYLTKSHGGTFNSQTSSSFDTSPVLRVRSKQKQADLLSITEARGNHKPYPRQEASLLDFDDDIDDYPADIGIKSMHGKKVLSSESQDDMIAYDFYGGYSQYTRSDSTEHSFIVGNATDNSERRMKFYHPAGYNSTSTASMFARNTLNTNSRVGFYTVQCSDTEEPLSCREKIEQPSFGCDENLCSPTERRTTEHKEGKKTEEESSSIYSHASIFSAFTSCHCFTPSQS